MISAPARPEAECGADKGEDRALSFPEGQVAIHYLDEQLEKARRSLRRTRAFCIVALFLSLGYMSFLTIAIRNRLLRPEAAADMVVYCFTRAAAPNGQPTSASVGEQPHDLVAPVSKSLATKSAGNSVYPLAKSNPTANGDPLQVEAEVAAYVHGFISQPHENLQDLIRNAQHPKTVQQLGDELDQEIREHLPSQARYGLPDPEYMSYVNQKLATLAELESQFDRLAHADDLTPYEKTLRHIIASTMGSARQGS
jgi:hypothetical protein